MDNPLKNATIGRTARNLLQTLQPPKRVLAGELAIRLADATAADPATRQEIVVCAMCIGQWLNDQGTPGRWDRLDPAAVLRAMGPLPPREEKIFLHHLSGLVVEACLGGGLTPADARAILARLPILATDRTQKETFAARLGDLDAILARAREIGRG